MRRGRSGGFTLIEIMLVTAIGSFILGSAVQVMRSSNGLSGST